MPGITVASRAEAELSARMGFEQPTLVIGINDPGEAPVDFFKTFNVIAFLPLWFRDTENAEAGMQTQDAEKIATLLAQHAPAPDIYVHCVGGVSRSAGIAAALGYVLYGEDTFVLDNPDFCANILCYQRVLEAFGLELSKDVLQAKKALTQAAFLSGWPSFARE